MPEEMKRKIVFPPVETASEDGLVAVGGDLEIDTILEAYHQGIFPWPIATYPMNMDLPHTWFSPDPRGILDISEMHVSKSFEKFLKKSPYRVTFNQDFGGVIQLCAKTPRKGQPGTWITPDIISAYTNLFNEGHAYSVEVWLDQKLVAGLYGVIIGSFISGESMFTLEDNASKQGFYTLLKHLQSKGIHWIDTQMVTEVVKQFGGKYIARPVFISRLKLVDWTRQRSEIL
jgi:leucyl/phenylalanyl-tRNA--protein transferase